MSRSVNAAIVAAFSSLKNAPCSTTSECGWIVAGAPVYGRCS